MARASKPNDADMLKPAEVVLLTGLSRSGVYKRIASGLFESVWTRGRVRVPRSSVEAYLADKERDAA